MVKCIECANLVERVIALKYEPFGTRKFDLEEVDCDGYECHSDSHHEDHEEQTIDGKTIDEERECKDFEPIEKNYWKMKEE